MFSENWHRHIFLFGLIALSGGMLFGAAPMSIAQAILIVNWLLEKNFSEKWQLLKNNKVFWVVVSFFVLHLIGLIYTDNFTRGIEDVKIKAPLFVLPLILFSSKPISLKEFKWVLNFFCLGVILSSIWCYFVFLGYTKRVIVDARQASVFMSHIRFSLCIAFAVFYLITVLISDKKIVYKIIALTASAWLLYFMYKLEMATGITCLIISGVVLGFVYLFKHLNKILSFVVTLLVISSSIFIFKIAYESLDMFDANPKLSSNILLSKTINGRSYIHDTVFNVAENGSLVGLNICPFELEKEWPKRSQFDLKKNDKKGNLLYHTLTRYISSKGFTHDSVGIHKLTNDDIKNIENGVSNYKYTNQSGIRLKWRDLVWEYSMYKRQNNPSGHSLSMRLEFWKTATYIIHENFWFGVGTGDVQDEFNKAYSETNSKLNKEWWLRSHNQYLAITVAFGFWGLILFLSYLFYPAFYLRSLFYYWFWPFFIITSISFITEDTLETQAGVTFFAFFYSLFLWLASNKKMSPENSNDIS